MALLRVTVLCLTMLILPGQAAAHRMGRTVPFIYPAGAETMLVAEVVASYFGEQMGRDTVVVAVGDCDACLDALASKDAPLAVASCSWAEPPAAATLIEPGLSLGGSIYRLLKADHAKGDLNFSLVDRYMEKLAAEITGIQWQAALARVRKGEGAKGVALDLLRQADLL